MDIRIYGCSMVTPCLQWSRRTLIRHSATTVSGREVEELVRDVLGKTEEMELSLTLAEERALERVGTGKAEWHG